jgi:hypothetical protein
MLFGYSYDGNFHVNITRVSCRQHCGATNFRIVLTFLQGTAFEKIAALLAVSLTPWLGIAFGTRLNRISAN